MNKKLLVLFAMMLATVSSAATDKDPTSTSTSLDEEVLDMPDSSSEDEEVDTNEDLLDVGDIEYEDEDEDTPSEAEDGDVRRYLRGYNVRRLGSSCQEGTRGTRCRINGHLGTSPHWPTGGVGGIGGPQQGPAFTTPQLPYCPNFSMQSTGMGPCMATQTPIPGVNACPSGTVGQGWNGPCVVW